MAPFVFADLINRDDVWMVEVGDGFSFALETLNFGFWSEAARENHFQGDGAVETDLPGLVNDAHAAMGDFFDEFVIGESILDFGFWIFECRRGGGAEETLQEHAVGAERI